MACQNITLPGGQRAIVCGVRSTKKCKCGRRATRLCDWKLANGTCGEPICTSCGVSPAPDKDLCRTHAAAFETWKAQRR